MPILTFPGAPGRRLLLAAALAFGLATPVAAQERLRVATEGAYWPFNHIDAQGRPAGFDIDIASALCARLKLECVFVVRKWDELLDGLVARDYDAVVASMSITAERLARVAFTDKYYSTPMRWLAHRTAGLTPTRDGLAGRTVGVLNESTALAYLTQQLAGVVKPVPFVTQEEALKALADRKVDGVLADGLSVWPFLRSPEGLAFEFVGEPINHDSEIGIALRKDDADLREKLNKALALIIIDGTYDEINRRYFPFSIY